MFVASHRIEHGEELVLEILPDDARKIAFLKDLKNRQFHPELAVAFRNNAVHGHLTKATTFHQDGREIWQLRLKPVEDRRYSAITDFAFNNYTPEDIAELRARRILLNEMPDRGRGRDRLSDDLIESMISRDDGIIKRIKSPLSELYPQFGNDTDLFLEAARLMSVLCLQLTNIVEHIFELDLTMQASNSVTVKFEGQRPARYANVPPHVIKFHGLCQLGEK